MNNSKNFDAIIIGAGIIGLCVSYYLTQNKLRVLIIEKDFINSSTSGSCNGNIIIGNKNPDSLSELALKSLKEYKKLNESLSYDFELNQKGSLLIINEDFYLNSMKSLLKKQEELGIEIEFVTPKYIRKNLGISDPVISGGLFCKIDSSMNPLYFNLALKNAIERNNGKFSFYNKVRQIVKKDKSFFCIKTDRNTYFSKLVINCAGYYSPIIAKMLKEEIPIVINKGCILVTETVSKLLPYILLDWKDINLDILKNSKKDEYCAENFNFVAEQTSSGNILIGKSEEIIDLNHISNDISIDTIKIIARKALEYLPFLRNKKIIRSYFGYRPQTPDNLPIIGESLQNENFFYATGHGGFGISLAPITGRMLSQLIINSRESTDMFLFSPARFSNKGVEC